MTGCGGGNSSNFNTSNVIGLPFSDLATSVTITGSRFNSTQDDQVSVEFTSETTASVTTPDRTVTVFRGTPETTYESLDRRTTMIAGTEIVGAPVTPDMIFFTTIQSGFGIDDKSYFFVDGNETSVSRLPSDANARYSGKTLVANGAGAVTTGDVVINVNFNTNTVSGSLTNPLPSSSADFSIDATTLTGNEFETTLSSNNTSVFDSRMTGKVFGSTGNQIGGSIRVDTGSGNGSGLFSTAKQ